MRSLRDSPSGCVTGKPSSRMTILRMPKPFRAFEPRIEMPMSRGPLPCFKETPGTSCRISVTEKTGVSAKRVMSMPVAVCAPGPEAPGTDATVEDGAPGFPCAGAVIVDATGVATGAEGALATAVALAAAFGVADGFGTVLATALGFALFFRGAFVCAVLAGAC